MSQQKRGPIRHHVVGWHLDERSQRDGRTRCSPRRPEEARARRRSRRHCPLARSTRRRTGSRPTRSGSTPPAAGNLDSRRSFRHRPLHHRKRRPASGRRDRRRHPDPVRTVAVVVPGVHGTRTTHRGVVRDGAAIGARAVWEKRAAIGNGGPQGESGRGGKTRKAPSGPCPGLTTTGASVPPASVVVPESPGPPRATAPHAVRKIAQTAAQTTARSCSPMGSKDSLGQSARPQGPEESARLP